MSAGPKERYFFNDDRAEVDPISGEKPLSLKYHAGGAWHASHTKKYQPCYDPSTGAVIAYAPLCTTDEIEKTIQAAVGAFPKWADTTVTKRVQVLFKMKALIN
jgi:malonate-semialdehyde dehydrogenase (acetylating)/methylmalonate-semialdehyde dehydrogenase